MKLSTYNIDKFDYEEDENCGVFDCEPDTRSVKCKFTSEDIVKNYCVIYH